MLEFTIIIPARFGSSRLPGKPLLKLAGKPMIQRVVERAQTSQATRVIVATDHSDIINLVEAFGGEAVLTRDDHCSGTDRVAEVASILALADDHIIVNVQGDEPDIPAELINQVAHALHQHQDAHMATACTALEQTAYLVDPNVVKVVRDQNQFALYFSRAAIPYERDAVKYDSNAAQNIPQVFRHLGIYAYRSAYVQQFSALPACALEQIEMLEQLRSLWQGDRIICVDACAIPGVGIDTPDDLIAAQALFSSV